MINKELIVLDSDLSNKEDIILFLGEKANKLGYISSFDEYIQAVKNREKEFPTSIGYEVSIPHGKSKAVQSAFIAFMRLNNPIKWDDEGEKLVRLVFLIGVPENKKETLHLKILAQISRKLLDENFRDVIAKADKENIYNLLMEIENNIISAKEK